MTLSFILLMPMLYSMSISVPDGSKREIILLAENTLDSNLLEQKMILEANPEGLAERDIIITLITPLSDKNRYHELMKHRKGFLFILIGKDGGKKLISETPVTLTHLFGLIDAMPMRKYEMESRSLNH